MAPQRWTTLHGKFCFNTNEIRFKGTVNNWTDELGVIHNDGASYGLTLCDKQFSGGTIKAKVRFDAIDARSSVGILIGADVPTLSHIGGYIGYASLFAIQLWDGKKMVNYPNGVSGERENLIANRDYFLSITVKGSEVNLYSDDVLVARVTLPFMLNKLPIGITCLSQSDIVISDYEVINEAPTAFVVMQFSQPFNELYTQVIKPICNEFGIEVMREDEAFGPGLIIGDIERKINQSKLIIAEITPSNPNVYYEVGYAHALNKPTILIAEKGTKFPFDISPFRILLYENSINGKAKVEEALKGHLKAILETNLPR
ncbi:MAG: hypothetical protein IT525_08545 [Nitrosomonas sp.]|jgi:hypothetical protein|nr:hypothetical protein [Nitrosomonas sp.]